jgi:hypothetical protein
MLTRPASPSPMRTTRSLPEPANLAGALIRYARVSTSGQNLDRQARALIEAGCIGIFAGKQPAKTVGRPELAACRDYLRAGGTLVVPSLDRLSRSLQDLITIVAGLRRRGTVPVPARGAGHHHPGRPAGLPRLRGPGRVHPGTHRGGVRAVRRRDRAARPGNGAAGLACRAPDAQVSADLGGLRRVRGAAEDRDLTQLRMPGFPAATAAGRGTP